MDDFDGYAALAWPRLLRSAWLLTLDWAPAAELAQTVLARAAGDWARISDGVELTPDAHLRAMLATTYLKRWGRRGPGSPTARSVNPGASGESLAGVLAALPRRHRAVLMLRFHADLTVTETARVLGWGEGTVNASTARALDALRADPAVRELVSGEGTR